MRVDLVAWLAAMWVTWYQDTAIVDFLVPKASTLGWLWDPRNVVKL